MKTRKILAVAMVMILSLCMLAGCSNKDIVTGKWSMTKAKVADIEQEASALGMGMMLEFKDGKVKVETKTIGSAEAATTGESTYKIEGNTVTITDDDGTEMTATIDGNTMTLTQNSVEFTLTKDNGKAYEDLAASNSRVDSVETTPAATAGSAAEATPAATAE